MNHSFHLDSFHENQSLLIVLIRDKLKLFPNPLVQLDTSGRVTSPSISLRNERCRWQLTDETNLGERANLLLKRAILQNPNSEHEYFGVHTMNIFAGEFGGPSLGSGRIGNGIPILVAYQTVAFTYKFVL